jgi:hypothetical protein
MNKAQMIEEAEKLTVHWSRIVQQWGRSALRHLADPDLIPLYSWKERKEIAMECIGRGQEAATLCRN